MKIGIITFSNAHNYGAVLQAWSLQTYLEKAGHQVEIVNLRLWAIDDVYAMAKGRKFVANAVVNKMINRARIAKNCVCNPPKFKKYLIFERFINHKLHVTKVYRSSREVKQDLSLNYDALIAGSDQIWNSSLTNQLEPAYFLDFGPSQAKRISYAASIGRKELPEQEKELIAHYLETLDYISVREVNAHKAIAALTDKTVEIVADPTFLLEKSDFDALKKAYPVKKPYIYVHNVHLVREDSRLNEVAEKLSKVTGLPIVSNRKEKYFSNEAEKFLAGSPEEFIGVISEAEYVVTNSFHATVFAIIYHRNFITIPHISNPDRMQNLLRELGISNHLMKSSREIPDNLTELDINYDRVESKKREMAECSEAFLRKALQGSKVPGKTLEFHGSDVEKGGMPFPPVVRDSFLAAAKTKHVYKADATADMLIPLAEKVIKNGGKCAFPVYNQSRGSEYILTEDISDFSRSALPELFEAEIGDTYRQIKELLEKGRTVLFIGSACRLNALGTYVGNTQGDLIRVEAVCHGCCGSDIYRAYMEHLEESYQSKLANVELANRFRRPAEEFAVYTFESGAVKVESTLTEDLCFAVNHNYIQEFPCYFCRMRGGFHKDADIVIGSAKEYTGNNADIEAMKFCTQHETQVVRLATGKGKRLWEQLKNQYTRCELSDGEWQLRQIAMSPKRNAAMLMLRKGEAVYEVLNVFCKAKK